MLQLDEDGQCRSVAVEHTRITCYITWTNYQILNKIKNHTNPGPFVAPCDLDHNDLDSYSHVLTLKIRLEVIDPGGPVSE